MAGENLQQYIWTISAVDAAVELVIIPVILASGRCRRNRNGGIYEYQNRGRSG